MKYNNDFKYDLELGNIGENMLGDILSSKKIEVKTDFKAYKTGNVYVEYESRGKSSGIATSEAEYWAFVLTKLCIVIIEKNRLKKMCRKYLKTNRDRLGGDNNTSNGILLPIKDLLK